MLQQKSKLLWLFVVIANLMFFTNCKDDDDGDDNVIKISPSATAEAELQTALINAVDGQVIELQAGTFNLTNTISIADKKNLVLRGKGRDQSILNFDGQTAGAEGIYAINMTDVLFADFTVKETPGDAIKVKDSNGVTFCDVATIWEAVADSASGAYGLYPVTSKNVLIDGCLAKGASDAGIYVGQSDTVEVRNSVAEGNVAGIEIENTSNADVYNNVAQHNTGGLLVFDLPNLPKKTGGNNRIFNNQVLNNDGANFAPPGNMVANVPIGTGIMLMAAEDVEVFDNTITNNNIMGIGIVSYEVFAYLNPAFQYNDPEYDPHSWGVHIHNNTFSRNNTLPSGNNAIGTLLALQFSSGDIPDILYDGIPDNNDFQTNETKKICIHDNTGADFCNLDAENLFVDKSYDVTPYNCTRPAVNEHTADAPACE